MLNRGTLLTRLKTFTVFRDSPVDRKNLELLPKLIKHQLVDQFPVLRERGLATYEYEMKRSSYRDARYECLIYDGAGKLRYMGRTFGSQRFSFWEQS